MAAALECRGLVKTFGGRRVLDGIDLTVEPATIFSLLGPNGSGKTTTIRTTLGLYRPDGGSVAVLGSRDPVAVRHRTGYLREERGLYARMNVREQLAFLASIRGLSLGTRLVVEGLLAEQRGERRLVNPTFEFAA